MTSPSKISKTTEKPLITIGITCFNAESSIKSAIKTALKQDWAHIEIIVVDDASGDNSLKIIKALQKTDPRITLISHTENKGYPCALNTIVENAKGDYIAFFDDDDESRPDRLSKQWERLMSFNSSHLTLCYSHRRVFINDIEKPGGFVTAIGHTAPEPHGEMVADYLLWHDKKDEYTWGEFGSCTMMASTKTLRQYPFDPTFRRSAEWDLAIRIAIDGGYFIAVDEPLVTQHKTPTQDKSGKKPLQYALMLRKKHKSYLQSKHVFRASLLLAHSRFHYFRQRPWKSRTFLLLAMLASPTKVIKNTLKQRIKK